LVQGADDEPSYVSDRRSTGRTAAAANSCRQGATGSCRLLTKSSGYRSGRPASCEPVRSACRYRSAVYRFRSRRAGNHLQIIQSPQAVIVRVEALRSQLIYLDGRPRPPASVHLETGAARGRWDGDILVVDYTNFSADALVSGVTTYSTPKANAVSDATVRKRLTERWKRLDDTHLLYGFTMDDPETRTKPYSVEFVMWRLTDQEQLVEYACHEGNVNLEFTLSGARAKEREEQEQQEK
jgi:hypothetical protein